MTKVGRAIIEECVSSTQEILEEEWNQIESMREEQDGRIKVSVAYLINFKGSEQAVKTTVVYGRKVTESRESIINPDQLDLPISNGEAHVMEDGDPDPEEEKPRRRAR